jgi:cell division protein FtsW
LLYFGILIIFGLLMLSSAGVAVGMDRFKDPYFFVRRQLLFAILPGIILFFVAAKIDYHVWKKYAIPIFILGLLFLLLTYIPGIGSTNNTGSQSWIGVAGHSFQPAEAVKLILIIFLSALLAKNAGKLSDFSQGFLPPLLMGMIPVALIALQPDIGTAAILFAIILGILFLAGARWTHIVGLVLVAIIAFGLMIAAAPYRAHRLTTFLHPELDIQGKGYQINQAFLAVGSGGWFGLGLGHSRQKFQYLPEVHADSIFAIIAEEMGFIITTGFIVLLALLTLQGFKIAKNAPDQFGSLLCGGIMIWVMVQSLLNIGAIIGLLPLTGVPLMFVSHGGSAILIGFVAMGMIVNVSKSR